MGLFDEDAQVTPTQERLFDPSTEADTLRANIDISLKTTPEQASRLLDLEQKTGLPSEFISQNLEHVSREAEKRGFDADKFAKQSPLVTKWLSEHPNHYAAAKDDLANLSTLEWMVKAPQRAYAQGKSNKVIQDYRMYELSGGVLTPEQEQEIADIKKERGKQAPDYGATSIFGEALVGGAEYVPQMTAQHLRGAMYAAPMAGAAGLAALVYPPAIPAIAPVATAGVAGLYYYGLGEEGFRMEAAGAYDEFLDIRDKAGNPINKDVARNASIAAGLINAGLEAMQGRIILKSIPGVEKFLGKGLGRIAVKKALSNPTVLKALTKLAIDYPKALTAEAVMEGGQRAVTLIIQELAKTSGDFEHKTPTEILKESAQETGQAFKSFAYVVAPGHLARTGINVNKAMRAKEQVKFFQALGENSAESKLKERLPDKYQEIVTNLTKDGPLENVYVDNEFFQTHWKEQGMDPADMADELGIRKQYDESLETGAKIAIPIGQYAKRIAGTEHNNAFAPELSVADDMMSAREADEYLKSKEPDIEPAAFEESVSRVREDVRAQLETIYPGDIADKQASMYEARFRARAQRMGIDPWELYQRRPLTIGQKEMPGGINLDQIDVEIDAIEEETGRTMAVKEKADVALKNADDQINVMQELLDCLGS